MDDGNNEGVYLASAVGLVPILAEQEAAPGLPGLLVSDPRNITGAFDRPALNDAGEVAFRAQLFDPGLNDIIGSVLYAGPPAALTPLLQDATPVSGPGIPNATLFDFDDIPELLADGTVADRFRIDDAGGRRNLVAFADAPGTFETVVALEGAAAPGGGTFEDFDSFTTNERRDVAFRSEVTEGGSETRRIIAGRVGALREIAATGDPAPGVPGTTYASVANLRLGYDGEVAYASFLVPTGILNNQAVYATAGGVPTLVALEGEPAPGGGVYTEPDDPVIGDGVVVFPTGNPPFSLDRLFAWTPEGGVQRLVGGAVEVAPGDFRSVADIDLATTGSGFDGGQEAGGPGEGQSVNRRNVLAFTLELSDGSAGVFTADLGQAGGLDLTAQATSPLTVAPGGSVSFAYTVTNGTDAAATGDLFFTAERGGAVVAQGRIRSGTVPAGQSRSGTYTQQVPPGVPAGAYTYTLKIGRFPSDAADEETFAVTVTGPAATGRAPSDASAVWTVTEATPWEPEAGASALAAATVSGEVEAFPNPFAGTATLRFGLAEAGDVRLAVYDVLGREVAVLADGLAEAGTHEVSLSGRGLAAGTYVWCLEAAGAVQTGALTLLR